MFPPSFLHMPTPHQEVSGNMDPGKRDKIGQRKMAGPEEGVPPRFPMTCVTTSMLTIIIS